MVGGAGALERALVETGLHSIGDQKRGAGICKAFFGSEIFGILQIADDGLQVCVRIIKRGLGVIQFNLGGVGLFGRVKIPAGLIKTSWRSGFQIFCALGVLRGSDPAAVQAELKNLTAEERARLLELLKAT